MALRRCHVVGAVPEPGCCCFGGTPYWLTLRTLLLRLSAGDAEFSDDVFVSVQTTSWFDVCVPPVPATGLRRLVGGVRAQEVLGAAVAVLNEPVPGDCAGQTVKPGCVEPASLGTLTMPDVSMCCIVTLRAPAASCAFEKA